MLDRIEREAADWAVRHPLSRDEEALIEAWLARDPRHSGALLRAMAGLCAIEAVLLEDKTSPAPAMVSPRHRPTRRGLFAGGIAVSAAAALVATGFFGWGWLTAEHITTGRGEIRRLPLADGSVATINSDSDLRIQLARHSRRVELDGGQAWFQVAKDRARPFVVDAGIAQARAVGTAFSVLRGKDGVQVAVTEGTVAIWPSEASGSMMILQAGQYANFRSASAAPVIGTAPEEIERALAWRNGEIALENDTLAEAIASFNRYNQQQIVLADPSLASERLVGLFKLDKPENFASMLSVTLDIEAAVTPSEIRLRRKYPHDDEGKPRQTARGI